MFQIVSRDKEMVSKIFIVMVFGFLSIMLAFLSRSFNVMSLEVFFLQGPKKL